MSARRFNAIAAAAALAAFTAGPALAQGQGHGGMEHAGEHGGHAMMMGGEMAHGMTGGPMGGGHGPMAAAMVFGPGPRMLLHHGEALGLSEEQAGRIDSLQAAMHATMESHEAEMEEVHEGMQQLASSGDPDMERYRELLRRMADARVELAVAMAETHREAMSVLTAEQRSNARFGMRLMRGMMGHAGPRGGMMPGSGMMMEHREMMMEEHGEGMEMEREIRLRRRMHRDTTATGGGGR